jgi:hypothetical protein
MESMGHQVDVLDGWTADGVRLPGYGYIAVAAEPLSFFNSRIPENLAKVLAAAGNLTGKKSAAFIRKSGPVTAKALSKVMRIMEKEGMCVNWSDVLINASQAEALGKRIGA